MISTDPPPLQAHIQAARRYAALSGPFVPRDAVRAVNIDTEPDTDALVAITSNLASTCDTRSGDGTTWLMREPERHWILKESAEDGVLRDAVAWRREFTPTDLATVDLLDALDGVGMFTEAEIDRRISVGGPRADVQRIALALERAGSHATAHGRMDAVRACLTGVDVEERDRALLAGGFFGRTRELKRIDRWLAEPPDPSFVRALFITGLPGIGKSTLLNEAVRRALQADPGRMIIRLDFDRAGLEAVDWIGLTLELARQVAANLPEHAADLRRARLSAAAGDSPTAQLKSDTGRRQVPIKLSEALRNALRGADRRLLIVLDTLEVLRSRATTHPEQVFAWVDALAGEGVFPASVLAAGRGDALKDAKGPQNNRLRAGQTILLKGLEDAAVNRFAASLGVHEGSFATVRELADGNPLAVRLAAKVILSEPPDGRVNPQREEGEVAAAYLYRVLLARIDDDTVRALAHPGLVVRRIAAEVIGEILGPALGMGVIGPARAVELFTILASHHWLVEEDSPPTGWVHHRADIRPLLLRLLYKTDDKGLCPKINRAASRWFGKRTEPWAQTEAAYHRLQLMRSSRTLPNLDPIVLAQLDEDTIAELPKRAQDFVRRSRGERSTRFRGAQSTRRSGVDPSAAPELQSMLERGDLTEGQFIYDRTFAVAPFDARSPDADVARAFLWRSGQWAEARRLYLERHQLGADDGELAGLSPLVALVRLEMWAEYRLASLVDRVEKDPDLLMRAEEFRARGVSSDLGGGALGFAVRRASVSVGAPSPIQGIPSSANLQDPVGIAFATWAPDLVRIGETRDASVPQRQPLEKTMMPESRLDRTTDQGQARWLAINNPYVSPVQALVQRRTEGFEEPLSTHVAVITRQIVNLGGLQPSGSGPWVVAPSSSGGGSALEIIGSAGLFAEWAGAAAFELRDRDLRLIAASAERWRRTMAGSWAYERRPRRQPGWSRPVDVSIADRVTKLSGSDDPVRESLAQLGAWSRTGDGEAVRELIDRRFAKTVAAQAGREPTEIAAGLLRHSLPSAFVPPLAILLSRDQPSKGRTT